MNFFKKYLLTRTSKKTLTLILFMNKQIFLVFSYKNIKKLLQNEKMNDYSI